LHENPRLAAYASLVVEGPAEEHIVSSQQFSAVAQYRPSTGGPVSSLASPSSFTSNSLSSGTSYRSVQYKKGCKSVSIKITKAEMKKSSGSKKPEFYATGQTYIELVDATANVEFVMGTIQKRWGNNFVIVSNDGLELEDVPATQGYSFVLTC